MASVRIGGLEVHCDVHGTGSRMLSLTGGAATSAETLPAAGFRSSGRREVLMSPERRAPVEILRNLVAAIPDPRRRLFDGGHVILAPSRPAWPAIVDSLVPS